MKFKFEYIIIAALVVALLLQKACSNDNNVVTKTTITKEIKWDTITNTTPVYIPKWHTRTEVNIDTFTTPIDTLAILKDYYAIYNYTDTIGTDSIKIVVNDSITKNKILSRIVDYKVMYPTITITITKETVLNKAQFYYGLGVGAGAGSVNLGPELLYKTKSNHAYGLGLGVNQSLQPSLSIKMYWKIGK
jgi:hypothetical protein